MRNDRVLLGMSGGVDSAVAAVLLQRAGYTPVGCTLRLYDNADIGRPDDRTCCSLEDVEDARAVCAKLGIDFFPFNFKETFRRRVMDDFVNSYAAGRTPNPCVQCNRYVKFNALLQRADELDIPFIATGHYARVDYDSAAGRWQLLRGADLHKDQSYFLYPLSQDKLSRLKLPVGTLCKNEVRAIARELELPCAHKADSQDICFVSGGDYMTFLRQYGGLEPVPGDFVDCAGHVLGRHQGQERYTTGQRRGLGVSADRPLYVLRKDAAANTVVLGDDCQLYSRTVWAEAFNWVSLPPQLQPLTVTAKTRYSHGEASATLYPESGGRVRVVFDQPQRAVTAGQSLVIYADQAVVGGGIICGAE